MQENKGIVFMILGMWLAATAKKQIFFLNWLKAARQQAAKANMRVRKHYSSVQMARLQLKDVTRGYTVISIQSMKSIIPTTI